MEIGYWSPECNLLSVLVLPLPSRPINQCAVVGCPHDPLYNWKGMRVWSSMSPFFLNYFSYLCRQILHLSSAFRDLVISQHICHLICRSFAIVYSPISLVCTACARCVSRVASCPRLDDPSFFMMVMSIKQPPSIWTPGLEVSVFVYRWERWTGLRWSAN